MLRRLRSFWRAAAKRKAFEDEMAAEMRFHLEMATRRNIDRGLSPDEARRKALASFGGLAQHQEAEQALAGVLLVHGEAAVHEERAGLREQRVHAVGLQQAAVDVEHRVVALGLVEPDHQTAARAVRLGPRPSAGARP